MVGANRPVGIGHCTARTLAAWLLAAALARIAAAQPGVFLPSGQYELSPAVQLDRAHGNVVKGLEQARAYLADKQWNEGINRLIQIMETSGAKLVAVTPARCVSVRDFCQLQLCSLPREALAVYRGRVDPQARRLYEDALATRDRQRLLSVVDETLGSSWADNALDALGEIALESGDCAAARSYWERIVPLGQAGDSPRTWPAVPDTELDLAGVRARLVLASILEGSLERAREELGLLAKLHPNARGRFAGRDADYVEALTTLLSEAGRWPLRPAADDWPTLAGSPTRNAIASKVPDVAGAAWRVPLRAEGEESRPVWGRVRLPPRIAEDAQTLLSYFPVVVGDNVFVNRRNREILALDLSTGRPTWGHKSPIVFEDQETGEGRADLHPAQGIGVARFTITASGDRLYARMGPAPTGHPREAQASASPGYLVCLELSAEGRLAWKATPEPGWAFEGSPVAQGADVYVAMRRNEVQPQVHVACFDAQTGQLRWRQFVCAADTPARGVIPEITHNLLTLNRETLYCNTNLGAVAALHGRDGRLQWATLYPRVVKGDLAKPAPHTCRDLNPCLYDKGLLLVAPADAECILALDATTGQVLWQSGREVGDVVHLLGVAHDTLIASGKRICWIPVRGPEQGRARHVWPEGGDGPGYGRGVLAGDCVLWPTREKIYVFDQATGRLKKTIELTPRGVTGGNLLVARGHLLIATAEELVSLATQGGVGAEPDHTASAGPRLEPCILNPEP